MSYWNTPLGHSREIERAERENRIRRETPDSYSARWRGVIATGAELRMLEAMWDAPDEVAKRKLIRDQGE